jgi:alpha-glucosidase (family GH31 glycosyl hydrolase)
MAMATAQGQVMRCNAAANQPSQKLRPFVLTRSFWGGSQRYGAMWTGDNKAEWSHLQVSSPMLLSINLAGYSFAGADVGGFFGDSNAELWTRWYQSGAFTPFFRGHAHHDTKRKEPWVYGKLRRLSFPCCFPLFFCVDLSFVTFLSTLGEPHTSIHRKTAMLRYSLLPYWYSVFFEAYDSTGLPAMRPMFFEFPENENLFTVDDQWMVGSSLLVKPVTEAGAKSVNVILPKITDRCGGTVLPWYELETLKAVNYPVLGGETVSYPVDLATIPAFIRPGSHSCFSFLFPLFLTFSLLPPIL